MHESWLIDGAAMGELRALDQARTENPEAYARVTPAPAGGLTTAADGTAEIRISGVLLPGASHFALYRGGSTRYGDIRDALAKADQDPAVKRIVLNINSPGGAVDGLFETVNAVRAVRKPISVRASAALSAAYALAAATGGPIVAESEASQFGSIGVATPSYYFLQGEEVISITSTEAPKKRPDVRTEEGRAVIREHLDAVHKLFVEAIAEGRRTKASDINANYGRGATLLAREARAAGMIDRIPTKPRRAGATAEGAHGQAEPLQAGESAEAGIDRLRSDIVARMEARRGMRRTAQPAAPPPHGAPSPAPAPAATGDVDAMRSAIMNRLEARRGKRSAQPDGTQATQGEAAPAAAAATACDATPPTSGFDLQDQIVAIMAARKAGQVPPRWATTPIGQQHEPEPVAGDLEPGPDHAQDPSEAPGRNMQIALRTIQIMRAHGAGK